MAGATQFVGATGSTRRPARSAPQPQPPPPRGAGSSPCVTAGISRARVGLVLGRDASCDVVTASTRSRVVTPRSATEQGTWYAT